MKNVLAVAAHPDDIEILMAGTLMRLAAAGYQIHYWNLANGCCGSDTMDRAETARVRRKESIASCEKLGAVFHEPICDDLSIFYDQTTLAKVTSEIRSIEPKIILTHALSDYMEDHMNACRLAVTAAFSRGMPNFPVVPPRSVTDQDVVIYHAQPHGNCDGLRNPVLPDLFVDIGTKIDEKASMLACHESQRVWLDQSQGMGSYLETMKELCRSVGNLSGCCQYAEGWRKHSHLGFCNEAADPLSDKLKEFIHRRDSSE